MKILGRVCAALTIVVVAAFLLPTSAYAQGTVLMSGPLPAGHVPMGISSGGNSQTTLFDSGPAGGAAIGYGLSEELLQARNPPGSGSGPFGTHNCNWDTYESNPQGAHYICLDANIGGGAAALAIGSVGTATPSTCNVILNGQQFPCIGQTSGTPFVATEAVLAATPSTFSAAVIRLDYASGVGAEPLLYRASASPCSVNAGAGDGGSQVRSSDGKCWIAQFPATGAALTEWGADPTATVDSGPACQSAANWAQASNGGTIIVPRGDFLIGPSSTCTFFDNTHLEGTGGGIYFPANYAQPWSVWASKGSAITCSNPSGGCLLISGTGIEIDHVNFGNPQPNPPSSGTWTPTAFGWPIQTVANSGWNTLKIHDVSFTGTLYGIDLEGPSDGIAGINSVIERVFCNPCANVGLRLSQIDDTMLVSHFKSDYWWFRNFPPVIAYTEANQFLIQAQYAANTQFENVESENSRCMFSFVNGSVMSGFGTVTFATSNWQLTNVSFNEDVEGICEPSGATTISGGSIVNLIAYADTSTTAAAAFPNMIDLPSDQSNWNITNAAGGFVQTFARIGAGLGGILKLNSVDIAKYSAFATGAPAFAVGANASFTISNASPYSGIRPGSGAGQAVGPGVGGQGFTAPTQVGSCSLGVEGCTLIGPSAGLTSGNVSFYAPGSTRTGYVGNSPTTGGLAGTVFVDSDGATAPITMIPGGGSATFSFNQPNPSVLGIQPVGLPLSCSGRPTGSWYQTTVSGTAVIAVCP